MVTKFGKSNSLKTRNAGFQANPIYLYEIDLRVQTANWLKQDIQQLQNRLKKSPIA
ncbi:hypothetical protein [Methylomonas rosea]|uniref:Uncharacterized protein n=1 Tax=Methylomonas rosea TaxID=2952227 RepID=A0ABT1TYY8_9GAMM|nr:hypothetical protein [Methylomonas sp. WSC-7]MCQ8119745.1 hypothetical protein [Methylomonas sp. WSC-7]